MPAKFQGFECDDGRLIKTAYFDGYPVGDRLLEGCMFKATVQDDGSLKVEIAPSGADYFSGLNQEHWLDLALKWAVQGDIFSRDEIGTGEDVVLI